MWGRGAGSRSEGAVRPPYVSEHWARSCSWSFLCTPSFSEVALHTHQAALYKLSNCSPHIFQAALYKLSNCSLHIFQAALCNLSNCSLHIFQVALHTAFWSHSTHRFSCIPYISKVAFDIFSSCTPNTSQVALCTSLNLHSIRPLKTRSLHYPFLKLHSACLWCHALLISITRVSPQTALKLYTLPPPPLPSCIPYIIQVALHASLKLYSMHPSSCTPYIPQVALLTSCTQYITHVALLGIIWVVKSSQVKKLKSSLTGQFNLYATRHLGCTPKIHEVPFHKSL